jgi:hypothetical protein
VQDLTADELFHAVGGCCLVTRDRALEQAEIERVRLFWNGGNEAEGGIT